MTETPRIGVHDTDRASSDFTFHAKMRRQNRAVLGLCLGCLSIGLSALHAQPVTSAYSEIHTAAAGTNSQSGPVQTSLFGVIDTLSTSEIWDERSRAQTSFGFNSAYAESDYTYTEAVPPESEAAMSATASYVLSWSTLDHSSSGNILSLSLSLSGNSSVSGLHLGSFQFQYGTQYLIQSSLSVSAVHNSGALALASSVWSDTFTIQGQPAGTLGIAGFDVNLNGFVSFSSTQGAPLFNFPGYPSVTDVITADFSNGASLDNVFLPTGASLTTDPGFPAIVTTPEPSAAALLLFSTFALLLRRRRR